MTTGNIHASLSLEHQREIRHSNARPSLEILMNVSIVNCVKTASPEMAWNPDGFFVRPGTGCVSYPEEGNDHCFEVEDASFWFRHRNRIIMEAMRRFPPGGPVFDIGGGNGYVTREMIARGFDAVLLEPGVRGVKNAQKRGIPVIVKTRFEDAGFVEKSLPSAGLFDVLEHIENDEAFLKAVSKCVRHRVYITVPAYDFLWSETDRYSGHYRRYTRRSLIQLLDKTGFSADYFTYFFSAFPLLVYAYRKLSVFRRNDPTHKNHRESHALPTSAAGRLLKYTLKIEEITVKKGKSIPFGSSLLVSAKKT